MEKKNMADVLINGRVYTISGYESTAYLQKVASYLNEIEEQISQTENYQRLDSEEKQLLKNMNLADAYFKISDENEKLQQNVEQMEKELYELKHDLIDAQMEKENFLSQIEELQKRLREEERKQVRLSGSIAKRKIDRPEQRL